MKELPECSHCGLLVDGAATPRGGSARNQPFPERSTGYCVNCHIGLTKIDGVWAATPAASPQ
jgi:hypothetical protein